MKSLIRVLTTVVFVIAGLNACMFFVGGRSREAGTPSRVARAKADMHTIASALENYQVDWDVYPAAIPIPKLGLAPRVLDQANANDLSTFELRVPDKLTSASASVTPAAYMSHPPNDATNKRNSTPYAYWTNGNRYWLAATGPDQLFGEYDASQIISSNGRQGTTSLFLIQISEQGIAAAYDPTNGSLSAGDLFRIGGK